MSKASLRLALALVTLVLPVSCQTTKPRRTAKAAPVVKEQRAFAQPTTYFMAAHAPRALTPKPKNLSWLQGTSAKLQAQIKKAPRDPAPQIALAQLYLGDGNLIEAQKLGQSALTINFNNRDAKIVLAQVAYLDQRYGAAKALFDQLGGAGAGESEALNLGGCLAWHDGETAKAEQLWQSAIKKNPADLAARMNTGLALLKRDQYAPAQEQFKAVLARWSENPDAKIQLGVTYAMQGFTSEALKLYQETKRQYPQSQILLFNMAAIQTRAKDFKGAVDSLRQFLNLKTLNYASHEAALALLEEIRREKGSDAKPTNAELDRLVADEANNKALSTPDTKVGGGAFSTVGFYN